MPKPNKYLLILLTTVVAYMLFEYYRPKPINWTSTYQNDDKIPFGTQALYELLPDIMPRSTVNTVRLPIYSFLSESRLPVRSNYIFVAERFEASKYDMKPLLAYVQRGNNVFISAYHMQDSLGRILGYKATEKTPNKADTTLRQNFVNPSLQKAIGYNFFHDDGRNFLFIRKAQNITVLGRNARKEPIFIRVRYGKGFFFVHNLPLAFTNYYVLDQKTSDYGFKALSYLPAWPTYWDEYQKQGRFDKEQQSIFRYVRSQPALNWAYYMIIYGLLSYALFAGKRTQRVIPVITPIQNTSLDFVKTVGQLYFGRGDHDNLARKKIYYFLAELRDRYNLNTNVLDKEFIETLARKSGATLDETSDMIRLLRSAQKSISLSEFDLLTLNRAIQRFKETTSV